jgi:hypothetical protein
MNKPVKAGVVAFTLICTPFAFADHNSPMGEGWANMPNDIHDTRVDTLGDQEAFREFVRYGNAVDAGNQSGSSLSTQTTRGASGSGSRTMLQTRNRTRQHINSGGIGKGGKR